MSENIKCHWCKGRKTNSYPHVGSPTYTPCLHCNGTGIEVVTK